MRLSGSEAVLSDLGDRETISPNWSGHSRWAEVYVMRTALNGRGKSFSTRQATYQVERSSTDDTSSYLVDRELRLMINWSSHNLIF